MQTQFDAVYGTEMGLFVSVDMRKNLNTNLDSLIKVCTQIVNDTTGRLESV